MPKSKDVNEQEAPLGEASSDESHSGAVLANDDVAAVPSVVAAIETPTQLTAPKNPNRCIVVRTVQSRERAYCQEEHGSFLVGDPFRVNGRVPEGAADLLAAFASTIALHVAQEARQRDIDVVRVSNADAGVAVAAALRESGFFVIEFAE